MATPAQERRAALRDTLIEIAERHIIAGGLGSLRARDLAKEAGCALGAIYNAVGDLNELALAVNARTFVRLGAFVRANTPGDLAPIDRLVAMAWAYHRFAAENHNAWRALFDIERPAGEAAPDWYLDQMGKLFELIHDPLSQIDPDQSPEERQLLTQALFSSVHGIILLALDEATAGVPAEQTDRMIDLLLRRLS